MQDDKTPCGESITLLADDDDYCGLVLFCEVSGDWLHEVHTATRWSSPRSGERKVTLSWRSKQE